VLGVAIECALTVAGALLEPRRHRLVDAIVPSGWGFDLAAAEMALAVRESRRSTADEFVLRNQLRDVAGYDVVLIDRPPSLGVLTLNATAASQMVKLATTRSLHAARHGRSHRRPSSRCTAGPFIAGHRAGRRGCPAATPSPCRCSTGSG